MDDESVDDDRDELINGRGGESRRQWYGKADGMHLEIDSKDEVMHI